MRACLQELRSCKAKEVEDIEARDEPKKQTKTMSSMEIEDPTLTLTLNKTPGPMAIEEKQSDHHRCPHAGHHSRNRALGAVGSVGEIPARDAMAQSEPEDKAIGCGPRHTPEVKPSPESWP